MVGYGQVPTGDDHIQHAHAHYFSPPAYAAALALPPIADLDYQFRFSSGGGAPHVGTASTPGITPTLEPDFRFNADYGMGSVGMGCEYDRGPAVDEGVHWGALGMGSPYKHRSNMVTNDSMMHDDVFRLLGSIGRLSPLTQGVHGQSVVSRSPSVAQAQGELSAAALHSQRPEPKNHGSAPL